MRVHEGLAGLVPGLWRQPAVTVGVFDGLHRGHQHVLAHLGQLAARVGGEPVVITFATHPRAVIDRAAPRQILSVRHRLHLLSRLGIAGVVLLPFDDALRTMDHERFAEQVLVQGLRARALLFGYNGSFGHGGAGTARTLEPLGARHGFLVEEAPPVAEGERPISSSRIRDAIESGDLAGAGAMLGRPVALYGTVVRGDGRGRQLGFPTANVDLEGEILPPSGVYEVAVEVGGRRHRAVANIGTRPTFTHGQPGVRPSLEVHVPGLEADLYGQALEVELVRHLRGERRFPSREALVAQVRSDIAAVLGGPPPGPA
ncbi:MAG: riboflavin biosynthesis protein RibF [Planctomycetia bacterium]